METAKMNYRFLRFLGWGRTNSVISGISQPILSSMISRRAMSATPMPAGASTSGRLKPPPPELSWRTRRETKLIRTFGLPTFSAAFLASSAFITKELNRIWQTDLSARLKFKEKTAGLMGLKARWQNPLFGRRKGQDEC